MLARIFSPILPLMPSAASITPCREPCSLISFAAVLGPTPGTPGMLSLLSPISAR